MDDCNRRFRAGCMTELARFRLAIVALILLSTIQLTCLSGDAQTIDSNSMKGGPTGKIGGGFSRFKESFNSLRQQQQAPVQRTSEQVSSVSRSQTISVQEPVIESFKQVIREEQQTNVQQTSDAEPAVFGSVQGTPGVDFPALTSIPNTAFSCSGVPHDPGMYADESTGCQVYHLCYQGRRESFLCGVGTIFNQAILNCDFWHAVDCAKSSQFYHLNADFGKSTSEGGASAGLQAPVNSFSSSSSSFSSSSKTKGAPAPRPAPVSTSVNSFQSASSVQSRPVQRTSSVDERQFSSAFSSGKVSPPKVSSSFAASSASSSSGLSGKTNLRRTGSILSPAQSWRPSGAQFAAESSQMFARTMGGASKTGAKQRPESDAPDSPSSNEIPRKPAGGNEEWKPFFKSKTTTTTTNRPQTTESVQPETSAPVKPAADQEPTFSGPSTSEETPTVPSTTPAAPTTEAPPVERPAEAAGNTGASIEPTVGSATDTTTLAPATESEVAASTGAPTEQPSTSEEPKTTAGAGSGEDAGVDIVVVVDNKTPGEASSFAPITTTTAAAAEETSSSVEYAPTSTTTASPPAPATGESEEPAAATTITTPASETTTTEAPPQPGERSKRIAGT